MGERFKIWFFVALVPFFFAVGYDFHANFMTTEEQKNRLESFQIDPKSYQNSDFGYVVMKYAPDQYWAAREAAGEEIWNKWVDPVLRLYTFVIALLPAALFLIWGFVSLIVDGASGFFMRGRSGKSAMNARETPAKDTAFKYKRR